MSPDIARGLSDYIAQLATALQCKPEPDDVERVAGKLAEIVDDLRIVTAQTELDQRLHERALAVMEDGHEDVARAIWGDRLVVLNERDRALDRLQVAHRRRTQ
jgi:hypothetical protein